MDKFLNFKFTSIKSGKKDSVLRVFELDDIPFKVKRVFTVTANNDEIRGKHAHKKCLQLLVCISGLVDLQCDDGLVKKSFILDSNSDGILISNGIWAEQKYLKDNSSLIVFCNETYEEEDYIRDYDEFINWIKLN